MNNDVKAGPGQPRNETPSPFAKQPQQSAYAPGQPVNGQVNGGFQPRQTGTQQPRGGPSRPGGNRNQNIAHHAQSIGDMELSNQNDLHAFLEAYRAILNYLAISAKLAEGQLKTSARAQARNAKDGWMNPAQRAKLALTLRQVGRDIDQMANACVAGATHAVKGWRRFEGLLDEFENGGNGRHRPGGGRDDFRVV